MNWERAPCRNRPTNPDLGPLFSYLEDEDDIQTGYIYVLIRHPWAIALLSHTIGDCYIFGFKFTVIDLKQRRDCNVNL